MGFCTGPRGNVQAAQLRLAQLHQDEVRVQARDDVHGDARLVPAVPHFGEAATGAP